MFERLHVPIPGQAPEWPFAGTRESGGRRSGDRHSRRQQSQGQVPGRPVARDAFSSEVIGLGHEQHVVTTNAHVASVETAGSGGTGSNANASTVTSQSAGGKGSRS